MADAIPEGEPGNPVRVPVRLVVGSAAALWACYYLLTTARGYVVGLEFQDELAGRRLLVALAGFAVTLAIWPLLRQLDGRQLAVRVTAALLLMLPASLLVASINAAVFADMEAKMVSSIGQKQGVRIRRDEAGNVLVDVPDMPGDGPAPSSTAVTIDHKLQSEAKWRQLTDIALGRYFLLLAWAGLYFALGYAEHARAAERREGEHRRAAKAAELRSLRYQVNPHFLFNTLNSLSALVITGKPKAAETMIQTLSNYYRRSLAEDPAGEVTLGQEIEQQRLYLELESVRFPERLVTRFDIPGELAEVPVPGMILQPLVENSVRYAVALTSRAVTVAIAAHAEQDHLVLTVSNDGPGAGKDAAGGFGIGLANVRDRLAARFGDEASVVSGPHANGGWRTVIRLPIGAAHG